MTYAIKEGSTDQGAPYELYLFSRGTDNFAFTSSANLITYQGRDYDPIAISRSDIKISADVLNDGLTVTFPINNAFASNYATGVDMQTTLVLYRGHVGDTDVVLYWRGRATSASMSGSEISLTLESSYSKLVNAGLRQKFETLCRFQLYGAGCNVDPSTKKLSGTVVSIADGGITIGVSGMTQAVGYFTGGYMSKAGGNGVKRSIAKHMTTGIVSVVRPMDDLKLGDAVELFAGCDHTIGTCKTKFNNTDNFGGFPYIPNVNPFGAKIGG